MILSMPKGGLYCLYCNVSSRSVELKLNGGTPFERGVELDPTVSLHSKF